MKIDQLGNYAAVALLVVAALLLGTAVGMRIAAPTTTNVTYSDTRNLYVSEPTTPRRMRGIDPVDVRFSPRYLNDALAYELRSWYPIGEPGIIIKMRPGHHSFRFIKALEMFEVDMPIELCDDAYAEEACRAWRKAGGGFIKVALQHVPYEEEHYLPAQEDQEGQPH